MTQYALVTREQLESKAAETGRIVLYPNDYQLFVDLDSEGALSFFQKQVEILRGREMCDVRVTRSVKPEHYHAVVSLWAPINPYARVALQAALGSDRKRELLAIMNRTADGPGTNCLFEKAVE